MEIIVKEPGNTLDNGRFNMCGNQKHWSEKLIASPCSAKQDLSGLSLSQDYHYST